MSRGAQTRVSRTRSIPRPNDYVQALYGEFGPWCLDEEATPKKFGVWRREVFNVEESTPVNLEIGTGNGLHFAQRAAQRPDQCWLGIELKYKPLIQSIRRALRMGCQNARMSRYNAALVHEIFASKELNNVFIHFPDPWSKLRQHKHRLLQADFFTRLYECQRPGSQVEIKMDSREYFDWTLDHIKGSSYRVENLSFDLHGRGVVQETVTQFERIFIQQGLPIHYVLLSKP